VFVVPSIEVPLTKSLDLATGLGLKHVSTDPNSLTKLGIDNPRGTGEISLFHLFGRAALDTRDDEVFPQRGILAELYGSVYPSTWNNPYTFGKLRAELRTYLHAERLLGMTLAGRIASEAVFGKYPFFEAAFIGGSPNLRGYNRQRFAGDASVVANLELRIPLARYTVLVPTRLGISALAETGRVFLAGEDSKRWHPSVGGSLWFSFVNRSITASLSVARSVELTGVYVTFGFMY
jgi:outer membrane protein assembly factor BamA